MIDALKDYDWEQVFWHGGTADRVRKDIEESSGTCYIDTPKGPEPAFPGCTTSTAAFDREDVVEIIGIADGENDDRDWVCCGKLADGRWFAIRAGCDYTGWG